MITINGKKMGKSYNNVITLTQLFSGDHPLLEKAYHPMVIRFAILQTHYRSTFDFSNEALIAAEKGLRRLWDAFIILQNLVQVESEIEKDEKLEDKINTLLDGFEEFMDDDFNTAKVLANMFELVPLINSMKDKTIHVCSIGTATFDRFKTVFKTFIEDIFGLQNPGIASDAKLDDVLRVLIDLRKTAKASKDFVTSDRIRNELSNAGILLKDEKDGSVSYSVI